MKNTLTLCIIVLFAAACSTKDANVPDAAPDLAVVADMAADASVDQPSDQSTPDQPSADLGQPDLSK